MVVVVVTCLELPVPEDGLEALAVSCFLVVGPVPDNFRVVEVPDDCLWVLVVVVCRVAALPVDGFVVLDDEIRLGAVVPDDWRVVVVPVDCLVVPDEEVRVCVETELPDVRVFCPRYLRL